MDGSFNTEYGKVTVRENVLARIAGNAALECFGIVGMAAISPKDGLVKLLTRNSLTKGIKVTVEGNKVYLDFHVIVAFGVAISTIAENLISNVKYQLETLTGFEVGNIDIHVEGVRVID